MTMTTVEYDYAKRARMVFEIENLFVAVQIATDEFSRSTTLGNSRVYYSGCGQLAEVRARLGVAI